VFSKSPVHIQVPDHVCKKHIEKRSHVCPFINKFLATSLPNPSTSPWPRLQKHIDKRSFFSGDQVVGRQKPAHHQEYCSDICGGSLYSMSHLYDYGCGLTACRLEFFMP